MEAWHRAGLPVASERREPCHPGVVRDCSTTAHEDRLAQRGQRRQSADGQTGVEQGQRGVPRRAVPAEGVARAVLLRGCCRAGSGRIHCLWRGCPQTQTVCTPPPSAQGSASMSRGLKYDDLTTAEQSTYHEMVRRLTQKHGRRRGAPSARPAKIIHPCTRTRLDP